MDWGLDEYFEPVAIDAAKPPREMVPEGVHVLAVKQASQEGSLVKLALVHDDARYGWVWCNMYQDRDFGKRLASELRKALGMTPEQWRTAAIDDIVGRRVECEIYHRVDGQRTYVNVGRFKPAPVTAAPEPAKPAARTARAKADAVGHDPDDIPF